MLVRAQFRYDKRFRLTVLSILPLTLVYMFSGFDEGGIDPFAAARQGHTLIYMAVDDVPADAARRADAERRVPRRLDLPWHARGQARAGAGAARTSSWWRSSLPYLAFLGVVYVAVVGRPLMVLLHVALLGLISHLLLVIDLMLNPDVPFSQPTSRGARTRAARSSSIMVAGLRRQHAALRAARPSTRRPSRWSSRWPAWSALTIVAELALGLRLESVEARAQFEM